ncbi:unnamed protein product [Adineta ricciae]|uniref:Uncharacterized protein n=1 Tax=Adineta ricciae TaxID=249248 RepID=A0A815ZTP3_ADIRI|nr:unnamed protein product [Adineta ricciae]
MATNQHKQCKNGIHLHSEQNRTNHLLEFYNKVENESCKESDGEWQIRQEIRNQWDAIHQAIDENNPEHLNNLLPSKNLCYCYEKYWSWNFYRQKYFVGENLLIKAVNLQHPQCVEVILDKMICEDLPSDMINYVDPISDYYPLDIACEKNNLDLVKKLVERGRAKTFQSQAFFIACQQGNEMIMNYLATRCNVQYRDRRGQTALDYAIRGGYTEVIRTLIYHEEIHRNKLGFSPLMLMAHHNLTEFVDLLFERLPLQEAQEELVLLACHYTIIGDEEKQQKAFYYFVQGLNEEESKRAPILHEAYEYRRECHTLKELLSIRENSHALRIHGLLATERILLRLGDTDTLLDFLYRQCDVYRQNQSLHRCLLLRVHAHQIALNTFIQQDYFSWWHRCHLQEFIKDLTETWNETGCVPISSIEIITDWLLNDDEYFMNLQFIFDFFATIVYMIQSDKTKSHERSSLFAIARRTMHLDKIEHSLLVHYIDRYGNYFSNHELPFFNVSTLSIIQLMILWGANVNGRSKNLFLFQPLHVIATCSDIDIAKPIIELLLDQGAHLDCINTRNELPQDLASDSAIKELLCPTRKLSLKCQCAQIIVSTKINYGNCLPSNLSAFVRLHDNK